jgi:hypothetical protein
MRERSTRCAILVGTLILLHLAGFSQDRKPGKDSLFRRFSPLLESRLLESGLSKSRLSKSGGISMGFFCRQEYKLEKMTRVPIRIRLGTYQEARRLEYGK